MRLKGKLVEMQKQGLKIEQIGRAIASKEKEIEKLEQISGVK